MKKLFLFLLVATIVVKVRADDAKNIGILPQLTIPLHEGEQKFYLFHGIMPPRIIPALYIPLANIDINFNTTKGVEVLTNRLNRINKASGLTFWGPDSITGVRAEEIWNQYFFLETPPPNQIIEMVALTPDGLFTKIKRNPYLGERIWCIKFNDGSAAIGIISDICCNTVVSTIPNLQGKILMKRDGTSGNNPNLQDGGGQQQQKQIIYVNGDGSKNAGNNGQPLVIYIQGASVTNSGNSGSKSLGGFGGTSSVSMPNQETGLNQVRSLPLTVSTAPAVMNPVSPVYTATATTASCGQSSGCGSHQQASVCSHGRRWPPGTGAALLLAGSGLALSGVGDIIYANAADKGKLQPITNTNVFTTILQQLSGTGTGTGGSGGPAGGTPHPF